MLPKVLCTWLIYFSILLYIDPKCKSGVAQKQILMHYYYFWFAQIVSWFLVLICRRQYTYYFLCVYVGLVVVQEIHYMVDMQYYFFK